MTYDNLSKFIAKGLGVFYEEDVAKARAQRILTYFQKIKRTFGVSFLKTDN